MLLSLDCSRNSIMSVNSHLTCVASSLVLSNIEKTNISNSISTLSSRLDSYYVNSLTEHFQFGSNTRGTILPRRADPKSDIDYMVVFKTDIFDIKKPQTYLDRLRKFAETKYSTSEIFQSSPTIVLSLNHINFELVPATKSFSGYYQIPSPSSSWGDWISTDPHRSKEVIQEKNNSNNSQIKPLVRLVKYWNALNGYPYRSFDLESRIVNSSFWFCGSSLKDYFYSFWDQFDYEFLTANHIKEKISRVRSAISKAKEHERMNLPDAAELVIKKIIPSL